MRISDWSSDVCSSDLNPGDPTDFQCDVCEGDVPKATDGGKKYTFKIRKDVKFHNGDPLTAHDVVATFSRIINPPERVSSARKAYYIMVEKRSEEHTSELQSLMRISYAAVCLKTKKNNNEV